MPPNCSLYNNGIQKALNAGVYNPAHMSACRLKQTLAGAKSSGLGKGGRRSTRRSARRSSRRSTRRQQGGANDECDEVLKSLLPGSHDWERMVEEKSSVVGEELSYQEWKQSQFDRAKALSCEDCQWLTGLRSRVKKTNISMMDMESCVAFPGIMVFFDKEGKIVIANDR